MGNKWCHVIFQVTKREGLKIKKQAIVEKQPENERKKNDETSDWKLFRCFVLVLLRT